LAASRQPWPITSKSEPAALEHAVLKPKSTTPKSSTSGTVRTASLNPVLPAIQDEDSEFNPNESAVGGMLEETDSLEQAVAMSSPVKGTEFHAAQKVNLVLSLIEMRIEALLVNYQG
jgi:hypothetical protein